MMKNQLLTYAQAQEIVAKNDNFYEKVEVIDGYKISVFNYILSVYDWFKVPFEGATYPAVEMRGLTFIHTENGVERFLMLPKFFNINENADSQVDLLKHLKIQEVKNKLDGSMIGALRLPNGRILLRTKIGFTNDQARLANMCLQKQEGVFSFVKECLEGPRKIDSIFELCSPLNKIVVDYKETELRLTQMRDSETGMFLDIYTHPLVLKYKIKTTEKLDVTTFEEILERQATGEGREGEVITLEDGRMFKAKTMWYFERHKLIDNASYENNLVKMICEETLDDALALLDKDNERRVYAENMQRFLYGHIKSLVNEVVELVKKYDGDKRKFAIENKENRAFHIAVKMVDKPDAELQEFVLKAVKEKIAFNCRRLEMARKYLNDLGFEVANLQPIGDE